VFVESFEKGLRVLLAFEEGHEALTLSEVAARTALPRAIARRLLLTLHTLGYAAFDGKRFSLTPRVLRLGQTYLGTNPLARVAPAVLRSVSETLDESSSVAVLEGTEVVYVARAARRRIMKLDLDVGTRLPAACTSMGRVLLAFSAEPARLVAKLTLSPFTEKTITDRSQLLSVLNEVRTRGFSVVDQELEEGLRSLAVPVRDGEGRVVAALNVSTQPARVTLETLRREFLPELQRASARLSALLG
jgi:IclR family transcriptional regulator, pca regulon regulatory protein